MNAVAIAETGPRNAAASTETMNADDTENPPGLPATVSPAATAATARTSDSELTCSGVWVATIDTHTTA